MFRTRKAKPPPKTKPKSTKLIDATAASTSVTAELEPNVTSEMGDATETTSVAVAPAKVPSKVTPEMWAGLPSALVAKLESAEFRQECDDRFSTIDNDKSNSLDSDELRSVAVKLIGETGGLEREMTDDEFDKFKKFADVNRDGAFDIEEWFRLIEWCTACGELSRIPPQLRSDREMKSLKEVRLKVVSHQSRA